MRAWPLVALCLFACTSEDQSPDGGLGGADLGASTDAAPADVARLDAQAPDADPTDADPADAPAPDAAEPDAAEPDAAAPDAAPDAGPSGPFTLSSQNFAAGGACPVDQTCTGADVQPELSWINVPAGTQSLVMVLTDLTFDYVHWVAYNLPAGTSSLPEAASDNGALPAGTQEANAYGRTYRGPCPPPGTPHTYQFRIYAMNAPSITFNARNPIDEADLVRLLGPGEIARATLDCTYLR